MKTFVRIAAIACGLSLAATSFAQEKKDHMAAKPAGTMTAHSAEGGLAPLPIAHMKEELKLSDEQTNKLKEAEANAQKEREGLDAKLTPEERNAKLREIAAQREKAVHGILTPEQGKQWSASHRADMRMKHEKAATPAKATEGGTQPEKK